MSSKQELHKQWILEQTLQITKKNILQNFRLGAPESLFNITILNRFATFKI